MAHSAVQEVFEALEGPDEGAAIALAMRRFRPLLDAISSAKPLRSTYGEGQVDTATLFRDGLKLASLYKQRGEEREADAVLQQLAKALAAVGDKVDSAQHRSIDLAVKRYMLVGTPAPALTVYRRAPKTTRYAAVSFQAPRAKVTVLLFFTSWCPQCLKFAPRLAQLPTQYGGRLAAYAATTPEIVGAGSMQPGEAASLAATDLKAPLRSVPLLLLSDQSRTALDVEEYPAVMVIDAKGVIRYLDLLPRDEFQKNGYMDRLVRRFGADAPPTPAASAVRRAARHAPPETRN